MTPSRDVPSAPAAGALVRALLRRELRPRRLAATGAVVAAVALAAGYALAAHGVLGALGASMERGGAASAALPAGAALELYLAGQAVRLLALPAALGAAYLVMERVAADHELGWLPALVAGGRRALRVAYPLAVVGGAAARLLVLYAVATLAAAFGLARGGLAVDTGLPRALPGVVALVLAFATYGALWGVLLRRRAALAAALGALAAPIAVVAWWQATRGAPPPHWLLAVAALHLPALSWASTATMLARQLAYAAAWLALIAVAAPRLVARYR